MAETLEFELVSPTKLLMSESVEMVVVPGSEGNFAALPGHAPMLSTVRPGVIDIHDKGAVVNRVFVAGGFAEVTNTRCTVLAQEAVALAELNREDVQATLSAAHEALQDADHPLEKEATKTRLAIAQAMLDALNQTRRAGP